MQQEKDRANDEALHWLIALQEDPQDTELCARFDGWLAADADNRRAWKECRHVWDALGSVENLAGEPPFRGSDLPDAARSRGPAVIGPRRSWGRPVMVALAGAVAICLAAVVQPSLSLWLAADYSTGVAESREIKLEDGSTVYLGADSAIAVSFETASRNIGLLAGEAYFEVAPDPSRPFNVETGNVETRVLGTGFNVHRSGNGVSVAVNHGRVAVSSGEEVETLNAALTAGDWVSVSWDGKVERGNDAPELVGGWRSGMLVVKDRPVADVIDEIRRHYKGTILSVDEELANLRVTGVYDLKRPIEALNAVVEAHGAHVRKVTPWVTVVSRW